MKKLLFSSLLCVVSLATFAATVTHDGVTYSTSGTDATVTNTGTLSEVYLPDYFEEGGVTYDVVGIAMFAINANQYITYLHIPGTITQWGALFCVYNNPNLKTITFGDGLTSIGNGAFSHNSAVEEIDLSNTKVESVGEQAFEYCSSMKTLLLPSTLVYLHYQAFSNCTSLTSVTCLAETPPIKDSDGASDSWTNVPTECTLYVPTGCAEAYATAERWSRFAGHIVELEETKMGSFEITSAGYATYYTENEYTMPDGVVGSTVTGVGSEASDGGYYLTMSWEYEAGKTVPAGTALVLQGEADTYEYEVTSTGAEAPTNNLLLGSITETTTTGSNDEETGYVFYELTNGDYGIGFYYGATDGEAFTSEANKAWLALTTDQARGAKFLGFGDGDTTGITSVEASEGTKVSGIYTLQGVRISDMSQPGIYIVNGKKVLVK